MTYSAYRKEFDDKKEEICLPNRYGALEHFDEELKLSSTSHQSDEGNAKVGVESKKESELGDDEGFQIVKKNRIRKANSTQNNVKTALNVEAV